MADENKRNPLTDAGRFELYTVTEVADVLRVSEQSVRRWMREDPPQLGWFELHSGGVRIAGMHVRDFVTEHGVDVEHEREMLAASSPLEDE
jgi:hypothetical protein